VEPASTICIMMFPLDSNVLMNNLWSSGETHVILCALQAMFNNVPHNASASNGDVGPSMAEVTFNASESEVRSLQAHLLAVLYTCWYTHGQRLVWPQPTVGC
jgi:hypothetical protein